MRAAEMVLAGTMLPGRGLTCMKSWALGEEFPTMRFTILMRVSLSLICSRGRNRRRQLRAAQRRLPYTPQTSACARSPGDSKGPPAPCSASPTARCL